MERKELEQIVLEAVRDADLSSREIPSIDLYVDQIINLVAEKQKEGSERFHDRALTKTMINNYTKAKIFPAPVKKKYSRTHLMLLIMIYHLKSVLSIKDIGILFQSALTEPNKLKQERMIESIYKGFVSLQKQTIIYLAGAAEGQPDESFYGKESVLMYEYAVKRCILRFDSIFY